MTVREEDATRPALPGTNDIDYAWVDIVLRRPIADLSKAIADQDITLSVRCAGIVDGATDALPGEQITAQFDTATLLALSSANKTKVKEFVALCEQGCKSANQTFTDDFSL